MSFKIESACISFIGNGRNRNEDNFYFNKKHLPKNNKGLKSPLEQTGNTDEAKLFAVFDGIGGEAEGDMASLIASETFSDELKRVDELAISGKEFLLTACQKANEAVSKYLKENQITTMGTTVASLFFLHDEVFACNVGDSKIFRIRDNQMIQISEDHTDERIISAMGIDKKPVLLQYLGIPDTEMLIEPFLSKGDIINGDIYVICSDGVTDVMQPSEIYSFVVKSATVSDAVKVVVSEVDKCDGDDNATIIIVKCSSEVC